MWVTVATAIEDGCPLDEAHTCEIMRLGQQTEEYMRAEVFTELEGQTPYDTPEELNNLFYIFVSRHKLPPIAVSVVTWIDYFDGAKLTDQPAGVEVRYGHGVTDADKEWQKRVDDEYEDVMTDADVKLSKAEYLEQCQNDTFCEVTETLVLDTD